MNVKNQNLVPILNAFKLGMCNPKNIEF